MHFVPLDGGSTRSSLMARLKNPEDQAAWREFEAAYRDLMLLFCVRRGLQHFDAEDVIQRVLAGLVKSMPSFEYDRARGRFRDYLFRAVLHAISDWFRDPNRRHHRLDTTLAATLAIEDGNGSDQDRTMWEEEWLAHHTRRAFATVRQSVDAKSLQVFERSLQGASVAQLAVEFQMTEAAVRKIRQRIRARMEEQVAEQIRQEDAADGA